MSRMSSSKAGRRVRRQFSEEFKGGAVRLVLDEGKTIVGINGSMVNGTPAYQTLARRGAKHSPWDRKYMSARGSSVSAARRMLPTTPTISAVVVALVFTKWPTAVSPAVKKRRSIASLMMTTGGLPGRSNSSK